MKKIVHREKVGSDPRKREISVDEIISRRGGTIRKRRSCKYYVRDKFYSRDIEELNEWMRERKKEGLKKNCHVFREINTKTGMNKVVCKVMGEFFAVHDGAAFKILYVNEIKMELDNSEK